ncbi:MAG: 23S rRNA (adenine(2503)-C(2))-methyltransferase RlmN [Nitrospirota bacterium]
MIDLKELTPDEIDRLCAHELGQKPGQGHRVAIQLFRKRVEDLDAMTDLNRPFRELLKGHCAISQLAIERSDAADDGTTKLLYRLGDGNSIEGVLIPGPDRLTLCVSTQVGCASGCGFCLTGASGLIRNLTPGEMVNQFFAAARFAGERPVTNIVLMGTGEPLGNYDAVRKFIQTATDRRGLGFSPKKVTLSTCGLAPMIERLADDTIAVSLAVSLNATTDAIRDRIMPVNKAYPIGRLMEAVRYYGEKTGRSVTIEYVLFKGFNDSDEDAARLGVLLQGVTCMINILMFNPFPGSVYERPDEERAYAFRNLLLKNGHVAVVRNSMGRDILAACGQLRAADK